MQQLIPEADAFRFCSCSNWFTTLGPSSFRFHKLNTQTVIVINSSNLIKYTIILTECSK